jgi:chemotaxis signal transduction protein
MNDLTDRQYLTLSLCEERYAIAIGSVREVL